MIVNRTRLLPIAPLRGSFLVAADVIAATGVALRELGPDRRGSEAIVYWAGRRLADVTVILAAILPRAQRERHRVIVDEAAFGDAAALARRHRLSLLGQVHTHGGHDVRHSDGDDDLVTLPSEGLLSLVVPNYGRDGLTLERTGVHQFQDRRWVAASRFTITEQILIVPAALDAR